MDVMATTQTSNESVVQRRFTPGPQPRLPRYVDWLVAAVLALLGAVLAVGGSSLFFLADRAAIADLVAEGTLRSDVLTDAALVDATYATLWWSGVGLLVTGVALVVAAAGYLAYRRREERRLNRTESGRRSVPTNATVGAVAAIVFGFVPFSPVLGGAVSGYLQRGSRDDVLAAGGLSGLLSTLPLVVVFLFLAVGLVVGTADALAGGALLVAVVVLLALLFSVLFTVGLGVLGGYVGGRIATRPDTVN